MDYNKKLEQLKQMSTCNPRLEFICCRIEYLLSQELTDEVVEELQIRFEEGEQEMNFCGAEYDTWGEY